MHLLSLYFLCSSQILIPIIFQLKCYKYIYLKYINGPIHSRHRIHRRICHRIHHCIRRPNRHHIRDHHRSPSRHDLGRRDPSVIPRAEGSHPLGVRVLWLVLLRQVMMTRMLCTRISPKPRRSSIKKTNIKFLLHYHMIYNS